jgi:toxin ParE1/3/4
MSAQIVFSSEAQNDLFDLYDYIAAHSSPERALTYIERIEEVCLGLETLPERGTRKDEVRPGLRIIGFERRVTIAFHVQSDRVTILRILYGGRDLSRALSEDEPESSSDEI